MVEKLDVPQEVVDLFDEAIVSEACMKECIKSIFRAKRAIFYGKLAKKAERNAWSIVFKLYPQTKEGKWIYEYSNQKIHQDFSK